MSLKNKLNTWVQRSLITKEQQEKILTFERNNNSGFVAKTALVIAGLFIGLGICLIVAANWDVLPTLYKFTLDFAAFGSFLYGVYYSHQNKRESFLLFSSISQDLLDKFFDYIFNHFEGLVWFVLIASALAYAFDMLYDLIKKKILLPKALSKLCVFSAYFALINIALSYGLAHNYNHKFTFLAVLFVALFLVCRMFWAFKEQNISSFKHNAFLAEAYIFVFFASLFDDLLKSGFGFILCGLSILLLFYIFKKTSKHIQKLEIFK